MKISRRNFLKVSAAAAALSTASMAGCAGGDTAPAATPKPTAKPTPEPTPVPTPSPTPEPPYCANVLTGEARDPAQQTYRVTGVMINNIAGSSYQNARPQRGIGSASVLAEIKVEGGITRFCAMFTDLADIPELGPMRSGRDQFLQLVMPLQGIYYHEGESINCSNYVATWDYWMYNFGGKGYYGEPTQRNVNHRDKSRNVATEHTMFTSGEEIQKAIDKVNEKADKSADDIYEPLVMEHDYGETTYFKFADYRYNEYTTLDGCEEVAHIGIEHSQSYRTYFAYDATDNHYVMSQYSAAIKGVHKTIDELTGDQLGFENVLVMFTPIAAYPGDSGDVQCVNYGYGDGYYFTNGKMKEIYWTKLSPSQTFGIYERYDLESPIPLNIGKTYLTMVDIDEFENFTHGDTAVY